MSYGNDAKKLLLFEVKPGKKIQTFSWTGENSHEQGIDITAANNKLYFADYADQLCVNGNLETWSSATVPGTWTPSLAGTSTVNREGTGPHSGTYCARFDVDASNSNARIFQNITLVAGAEYILSLWYKTTASKPATVRVIDSVAVQALDSTGAWVAGSAGISLPAAAAWTNFKLKFTMTANTVIQLLVGHNDEHSAASCSIYFDDVYLMPKLTATLTNGNYTHAAFLTEVDSKMTAAGGAGAYTISHDSGGTNKFTIASSTLLYLYCALTTNAVWATMGYSTAADSDFALSHVAGTAIPIVTVIAYYCSWTYGEVTHVKVDGTLLTRKYTLAECWATAGSFYHDFFSGVLHVFLTAGDSPGAYVSPSYTHNVIAFTWKLFTNRQGENGETISFIPTDCIYPVNCEPALRPGTLSELSASVADHFESAMQTSFGAVAIVNDLARWYTEVDDWLWGNKDARVRLGEIGNSYADLTLVFVGKVRSPEVSDVEVIFDLYDTREGRLRSIPPDHFDIVTYPNAVEDIIGQPIPILFGEKTNITPRRIDTVAFKFKISATHFNSGADVFEMESIDAVYMKGVALSVTTHYVEDLHNGEFTLTFDPGDAEITCDAKGIKDGFDFDTSPFGAATGLYSENVADHLFFILHILNQIDVDEIDLVSFTELQAARTQAVAWFLDQDTPTIDVNRLFQKTSLYHFLPLADGTFAARYYRKTIPTGTLELRNYDHTGFRKKRPNEGVFRDIFLKYAKDPTSGNWKQLVNVEASVEEDHDSVEPLEIETALRDASEAAAVLAFYVALLKDPPTKIETAISMIGRSLIPTDKIYVNRDVLADGHAVTIAEDEVYVILEANRNFAEGKVEIKAQLDTQLAIYTVHADSAHQDVPHADHSDTVHTDDAHGDSHTDEAYVDTPHEDIVHEDEYYQDNGEVRPHVDVPHVDVSHEDVAHGDTEYVDIPHVDTGHVDHTDTIHTDAHTDISHIDSEV